jgi:hypothetical protein
VNLPSVKSLTPDHGRGNSRHTQSCREKGKRGSVVEGRKRERERARQGSRKRTGETLETQGVLNIGEGE